MSVVAEKYARSEGPADLRRRRHDRACEELGRAIANDEFDGKGFVLNKFATDILELTGSMFQHLRSDDVRFSLVRLLDSCWISRSVAKGWLKTVDQRQNLDIRDQEASHKRGPLPALRNSVESRMTDDLKQNDLSVEQLRGMKGAALAELYGASEGTVKAARKLVLAKFQPKL